MQARPISYSFTDLLLVLHDAPAASDRDKHILGMYFTDVYKLLVSRLAQFEVGSEFNQSEANRIRSLVDELIRVKSLLGSSVQE